ncbi:protein of unknown function [Paenibacillus alvei]|uniref:Uncharacterized protein n=1 Tax=Paenibacillus alvei TaxID=44250 RepID=A0A383RAR8_PAEAL|nr:protein of unknown function [Paenibacillus alvei]
MKLEKGWICDNKLVQKQPTPRVRMDCFFSQGIQVTQKTGSVIIHRLPSACFSIPDKSNSIASSVIKRGTRRAPKLLRLTRQV